MRVCLLNCLHIGAVNVVLPLAENVAKVVDLDLELLIRLVLFETELVVRSSRFIMYNKYLT